MWLALDCGEDAARDARIRLVRNVLTGRREYIERLLPRALGQIGVWRARADRRFQRVRHVEVQLGVL